MEKTKEVFDNWNQQKQIIDLKGKCKRVKAGEIWLCKIWVNIWWEISKDWKFSRPVLVVSNKLWWDLVWVIPLTTVYRRENDKYLLELENYKKYWLKKKSYLLLNQFKILSLKRLERKLNWYILKKHFIPLISTNKVNYYLNKYIFILK